MRYPGCQKAKAFKLFDQGKRPSEIYHLVKVKKHTLYDYHQQWKREREEENERMRLAEELQQRPEEKRKERERKQEERWKQSMAHALQAQRRIQLETEYENQKKRVLELEAQMSKAADKPNNDNEIQRIGRIYTQEYEKFMELTRKLYPQYADEKSIDMALHPKPE